MELPACFGFGCYVCGAMCNAARIGLFPEELLDKAASVGNTSIEGASAVLLSSAAREELARIVEVCDYVELSGDAAFNAHYIDAMMFE